MKCIHNTAGVCDWTEQPCRSPACNEEAPSVIQEKFCPRCGYTAKLVVDLPHFCPDCLEILETDEDLLRDSVAGTD